MIRIIVLRFAPMRSISICLNITGRALSHKLVYRHIKDISTINQLTYQLHLYLDWGDIYLVIEVHI
jgi:hypothetical protein